MEQELRNLELLRGIAETVQVVAVVTSVNPYQTLAADANKTIVIRGVLLEYHRNGTLADALVAPSPDGRWREWAAQLTTALCHIHSKDLPHMDLKPSNVVFSSGWNAVLIDISGIEGVTPGWLSPEMRGLEHPLSESIELRKQNDVWALGKMILDMALASQDEVLKAVADDAMLPATARISLSTIAARLS